MTYLILRPEPVRSEVAAVPSELGWAEISNRKHVLYANGNTKGQ